MTARIRLADSFVRDTLSGALGALTYRPGPDGKWDLYDPPSTEEELAPILASIARGHAAANETRHAMLAFQYGLSQDDERLARLAVDDQYDWTPTTRRAWIKRIYSSLYPAAPLPGLAAEVDIVPANLEEWIEIRDADSQF
ncbi:MAG: hypothetical protein IPG45_04510 [Deltaproteobacteria bacterium]|nr:hypothetical protein [Deltaproteobacteria bacterium]